VWSDSLIQQVQVSVHRFNKYIESADAIRNEEISKYKKDWMSHALDLIPDTLLQTLPNDVRKLFAEVFAAYSKAMKQSILEYILLSPDERKRLHILMIPRPVPTSSLRQSLAGGYSTVKYAGSHARKLETENEIKLRLLNNNVVISALQSWLRDFRSINLVELKGLA
jgi:dynein heavy chain